VRTIIRETQEGFAMVKPPKALSKDKATQVVFGVIKADFPDAVLSADQKLALYGYDDGAKLIGLGDEIYAACDILIKEEDIIQCEKISDVIKLLTS
jgi:hypothetical protein